MKAETRSLLEEARRSVELDEPVLAMLEERRPQGFAHDTLLREYLEAHVAWWRQVRDEIERTGDDYVLPEVPEVLASPGVGGGH
jgi:hypothetical protein